MPSPLNIAPPIPPLGGVPVGTILPYVGPLDVLTAGWRLCNGDLINDPESPFNGQSIPNISDNRFLMGVGDAPSVNQTAGRNDIPGDGNHGHSGKTGSPWDAGGETGAHGFDADENPGHPPEVTGLDHKHPFGTSEQAAHTHGGENRPQFLAVYFIIRIK